MTRNDLPPGHPLQWPTDTERTARPARSSFSASFTAARDGVCKQVNLLGGQYLVISSNLDLRGDGLPKAVRCEPTDTGVAVYFLLHGKPTVFACDKWDRVRCNLRAIEKTIEAMRGTDRWGVAQVEKRVFSGFAVLPPPGLDLESCWDILGVPKGSSLKEIHQAFRRKSKEAHPDSGGTEERFTKLNAAYQKAITITKKKS